MTTAAPEQSAPWHESSRLLIPLVCAQWALAAWTLIKLDILNAATHRLFLLVGPCFLVNALLPLRFRLAFFLAVCAAAATLVLGGVPGGGWNPWAGLMRTTVLAVTGTVLVGICLLRTSFAVRAILLCLCAIPIGLMRTNVFGQDGLLIVWPVLASLVMFRIIVFLYDVSTSRSRPSAGMTAAYFSLFPNLTAPLFPIVDFKGMVKSYYDSNSAAIYSRGGSWILRGVLQLVVYRFVQQLISIDPGRVSDGTDVFLYVAGSTFVYLQVSGLFHLLIGTLLLFGFNLPETNHRYFFATSFTDYWRRVNIYWKDFILKVFYYPMYFRIKGRGTTVALVVATLWSFLITWALHLYQTWWLKGVVSLSWPDAIFWSTLAVLVLINSLVELKKGRARRLKGSEYSLRQAARALLANAGTFLVISILWSLWNAPTLSAWVGVWKQADLHTALLIAGLVGSVVAAKFIVEVAPATSIGRSLMAFPGRIASLARQPGLVSSMLLGTALLFSLNAVQARIASDRTQPWLDALVTTDTMMDSMGNRNRGYYQALTSPDPANTRLWETFTLRKTYPGYDGVNPVMPTDDFRTEIALPGLDVYAYHTRFRTNSHGMRDREYSLQKPGNTLRIAMLGSSHTMGWGIDKGSTFEALLERRLNDESEDKYSGTRFEILNFAHNRLSPLGQINVLNEDVANFHPDLVLLVAHSVDFVWTYQDLVQYVHSGRRVDEPFLRGLLREARITPRTAPEIAAKRLEPHWTVLLEWSYRQIAAGARELGAVPMAALVPIPFDYSFVSEDYTRVGGTLDRTTLGVRAETIRQSGFSLIDMTEVFSEVGPQEVLLVDGLLHSNETGHRLIADWLHAELTASPQFISLYRKLRSSPKRY